MLANGPGHRGLIPGQVIPKTQKMVLDAALFSTQHYEVRIKGLIPGQVIPKTQKMVLDAALFSTQHYEVRIKGKVEQSWEWSSAVPYISV